tara:strand:+ start:17381 stop:17614 length:234 start_codon:yes stop_codon:yes gene_type:complete
MKEVIRIPQQKVKEEKPVEFTHSLNTECGWRKTGYTPNDYENIIYLGKCKVDGDMFAAHFNAGIISILKGHLNSGKY